MLKCTPATAAAPTNITGAGSDVTSLAGPLNLPRQIHSPYLMQLHTHQRVSIIRRQQAHTTTSNVDKNTRAQSSTPPLSVAVQHINTQEYLHKTMSQSFSSLLHRHHENQQVETCTTQHGCNHRPSLTIRLA